MKTSSGSRKCHAVESASRHVRSALDRNSDLEDRNRGMEEALSRCEDDVQCLAALARRPLANQRAALAEIRASLLKATERLLLAMEGCGDVDAVVPRSPRSPRRHSSTFRRRRYDA